METVLVTGGCGYIGSHTCVSLLEHKYNLLLLDSLVNSSKDTVEKIHEDNSDQDFFSAIKICKKKKIGPARTEDNRTLFYKKDISLLARNGFDFETSKKVMEINKEDYLKIIKLL